jgi:tRNA 2-selenouridine synthase
MAGFIQQERFMERIDIERFLHLRNHIPVIDVRSPAEYERGHIPGAFNLPLFDNQERAHVGTLYKRQGRQQAVMEGLSIVGPKMAQLAETSRSIAGDNQQLIFYCWRGGMRSESMAWLVEKLDIHCYVLEGGYKTFRRHGRQLLTRPWNILILGGYTGSGKTEILRALAEKGEQVVDLEALARHKGSAFGAMGQKQQLATEHFENLLFDRWLTLTQQQPLWLEDESKMIGRNVIPDELFHAMRTAPVIKIEMPRQLRVERLVREYAGFPKAKLHDSVQRISKRLGGDKAQEADLAIDRDDFRTAIHITLDYYDKAYHHGLSKRSSVSIHPVLVEKDDPHSNARKAAEKAREVFKRVVSDER